LNVNPRSLFFVLMLLLLPMLLLQGMQSQSKPGENIPYSQFIDDVKAGRVGEVSIEEQTIRGVRNDNERFTTYNPNDPGLLGDLLNHDVIVKALPPQRPNALLQGLISWFPLLLLVGVYIYFMRRGLSGPGGNGITAFGKSRARKLESASVNVTFADVAGAAEAKQEVAEFVEFLKYPEKFRRLGGSIPRGALMVGPPGTGKTLLAKAIAGEAGVPFFSVSGSDFVEMFVGVGASRVRDLFNQARQQAPCIIFIDEIDAVGRRRGTGLGGGHDEREQTLNQLLVEMDGFGGSEGIIVIAATNRPDVLDPALLRPGRFDRQVAVPLPDVAGREQILQVHMRKVPLGDDVDARIIARGCPGFSGADLANLVNEAALLAAQTNQAVVTMAMFERAKDELMMGTERRSAVMSAADKAITAYHEAGHVIVGRLVPGQDPVHKVSIIPRGRALGVTLFLPEQDHHSLSKRRLESQISTLFGGRVAEELVFGPEDVTTGAQNDIERATEIARNMVTRWGLSDNLGALAYAKDEGEIFLGQAITQSEQISPDTARLIDAEVRAIIDRNYQRAQRILTERMDTLHLMAETLVQYETLDRQQIDDIMAGNEPRPPQDAGQDMAKARRNDDHRGGKPRLSGGAVLGRPVSQH
jgi:cell division protease FtsH